ncbi:hypothetical protein AC529_12410 [Thermobifida cellulosilytica TB100]|uniref:Uncharacterized protein n=2 Tax=Thermobifida cellulosilytica TaxID=144786 RepID=A0A147KGJ7_THECS|nr:hypothetical protein AC529_12410 [Thermobifida cellulosilytica TB100]
MLGCGMAAAATVYTGTLATVDVSDDEATSSKRRPTHSVPDVTPGDGQDLAQRAAPQNPEKKPSNGSAVLPEDDYIPTFFDGHGGIAGVEFTEEQRQALVEEAVRRGMTEAEARELAYGSDNAEQVDDAGAYIRASGTLYRHLSPDEEASYEPTADNPDAGNPEGNVRARSKVTPGQKSPKDSKDKAHGSAGSSTKKTSKPQKKAKSGIKDTIKGAVKQVVPDPIEDAVKSLPDGLVPFRTFMADISLPGTEPQFTVYALDTDRDADVEALQITATTQMSESVTVIAEVVAPVGKSAEAPPCIVEVTLTDPTTDVVIADPEPVIVENPQEVSQAAIGEIVNTVVEAAQDDTPAERQTTPSEPEALPVDPNPAARNEGAESQFALAS